MSYQQIIIVGNLGRDPELKYLPSGVPVCNFTVAVSERRGTGEDRTEKTTWFRVAAWRQQAEIVSQYLTKGRQVMIVGRIDARAYTDNSGQPQASLELTADRVVFLSNRGGDNQGGGYDSYDQQTGEDEGSTIPF